jgi:hypothetical protein
MRLHSNACVPPVRCVLHDGRTRGADAPRSCVSVRMSAGEKTMFAMHERTLPGAAGVSPPWVCKPRLQFQCDEFRRFEFACAGCIPRGADAPRSCVAPRSFAGEITPFAMHERTLPGAAGVSPPWVCKPRLQFQCDEFRRFEFASAGCVPRGLTPPALVLVCGRLPAKKRCLRCTNAQYQERRASARRGSHDARCARRMA